MPIEIIFSKDVLIIGVCTKMYSSMKTKKHSPILLSKIINSTDNIYVGSVVSPHYFSSCEHPARKMLRQPEL